MSTKYIGRYQRGEVPEPLVYDFDVPAGGPLDLTPFDTVEWAWRAPDGTDTISPATFADKPTGVVECPWTSAMTADAGTYEGIFWLAPGPVPSISLVWTVVDGPGPTAP